MATDADTERKQTLALYHVAREDIAHALAITEKALSTPGGLDKHDLMSRVFQVAAVVTYARPFTRSDGIGRLEGEWTEFLGDVDLQRTHEKVMEQRHQVMAHADLKWRPLFLTPAGTTGPEGLTLTEPKIMSLKPSLEPVSYEAIRLLCLHLFPRLCTAFDALYLEIFPSGVGNEPVRLLPAAPGEEDWIRVEITRGLAGS